MKKPRLLEQPGLRTEQCSAKKERQNKELTCILAQDTAIVK